MAKHEYYDQLTAKETWFVDEVFREALKVAKLNDVPLLVNDYCEDAVDAFSKLVIQSRKDQ